MKALKLHVTDEPAGPEEGHRPTGGPAEEFFIPSSEVVPKAKRRYLTVAYKLKVLDTVADLREQGQGSIGAYLRKEGLYYSSISSWEKLREQGLLTNNRKGPREKSHDALLAENRQLRRELQKTQKRLVKSELIVELQKKLSAILDIETQNQTGRNGIE